MSWYNRVCMFNFSPSTTIVGPSVEHWWQSRTDFVASFFTPWFEFPASCSFPLILSTPTVPSTAHPFPTACVRNCSIQLTAYTGIVSMAPALALLTTGVKGQLYNMQGKQHLRATTNQTMSSLIPDPGHFQILGQGYNIHFLMQIMYLSPITTLTHKKKKLLGRKLHQPDNLKRYFYQWASPSSCGWEGGGWDEGEVWDVLYTHAPNYPQTW